jgi:hypothetical protein
MVVGGRGAGLKHPGLSMDRSIEHAIPHSASALAPPRPLRLRIDACGHDIAAHGPTSSRLPPRGASLGDK